MPRFTLITSILCLLGAVAAQSNDLTLAVGMMNQARAVQGLAPLAWDPNLAAYANVWADEMAAGQVPFGHASGSLRPQQGENIYEQAASACNPAYDAPLQTAVKAWLAEASLYTGQPVLSGGEPWLHWSQIMWTSTTSVGCARAYSISEAYKVFDVCRFYPEGNIIGQTPF